MKIKNYGNSRHSKIFRFLGIAPPRTAQRLVLSFVVDEEREIIASWEPGQVTQDLATRIDEECTDLAEEITSAATGSLAWVDQSGAPLTQKTLRIIPANPSHLEFAGTNLDQARQAQKHLEAMTRVFVGSMHDVMGALQSTLTTQTEIMQRMAQRMEQTEDREQGASEVIDAMQSEIDDLREQLKEAAAAQGNEKEDRIMKLLEGAISSHMLRAASANAA